MKISMLKKTSEAGATLPRFLHRRAAGNMEPLTGGDAGRIRMSDRWLLILTRSNFKKFTKEVSKKLEFGHLRVKGENDDDDLYAEKFSGGGVILLDFSHVGVRGVWLNVQLDLRLGKKFCSGVSKIADFRHL